MRLGLQRRHSYQPGQLQGKQERKVLCTLALDSGLTLCLPSLPSPN